MTDETALNSSELKKALLQLEEIIPTIDKIGSGFENKETAALALLLFFRERNVLNKLSFIRKTISHTLSKILSDDEFQKLIETDVALWKPPYNKEANEISALLDKI